MAIEKKLCTNCDKSTVCEWYKTINKFDDELAGKKLIPVLIEMKECPEYKEVE